MNALTKDALLLTSRQELIDTVLAQQTQICQLRSQIEALEFKLEWFKRQVFGTKSERFVPDDDLQVMLDLGVIDKPPEPPAVENLAYDRRKPRPKEFKGHGRGQMPTHLPIVDVVIEPDGDLSGLKRIGEEVSWHYEMEPGSLRIIRTTRPKYVRRDTETNATSIVTAALPALPVEKGNAGPGLMTQVTVDKYVYGMPLWRQHLKFKNEYGVDFSESWLVDIVKHVGELIGPVSAAYQRRLLAAQYLLADETPIPVLSTDVRGKTHRGYFWVYYDPLNKIVVFDYRETRAAEGPCEFLAGFSGVLQVDGYGGYDRVVSRPGITRAACMDHVRRRFERALAYDAPRVQYALDQMKTWYAVERESRESKRTLQERFHDRVARTVPSMEAFGAWLMAQAAAVLPKSAIGVAVSYALGQWPFFKPFMTDARVELSNILVENAIRPVAIGRKNYQFKGSHDAAKRGAAIYSLVSTAKLHGFDPYVYIKDLLVRLPGALDKDIDQFLLPQWKPT